MQFVIVAKDVPGEATLDRRLAARTEHMAGIRKRKAAGEIIGGGAILDEEGRMTGSIVFCEFPDRAALDVYLAEEVYAREGVWGEIVVHRLRRVDWRNLMAEDANAPR